MLSYDINTGVLNTSFAPVFNGKVNDVTVTPDHTKLIAVGTFTQVNGLTRNRAAVFNLSADGSSATLSTTVVPNLNGETDAVAATNSAIYFGGWFGAVNGTSRPRIAAVNASDGSLMKSFSVPVDNQSVQTMVLSPQGTSLVLGGNFTSVGGSSAPGYGLARVDATSGSTQPLPVNDVFRDGGLNAGVTRLQSDGNSFYGGGWVYGSGGNAEGAFQASWSDGNLVTLEDCHGDTYDVAPVGDVMYIASHEHYCGNSGGFPQTDPWTVWHGTAWTKTVQGTNTADIYGYPDHPGTPRPGLLPFFPDFTNGTYTGKGQATWTVTGNSKYILYAGEFPKVNGVGQQGLARFTTRAAAPNLQGPRPATGTSYAPTVKSIQSGTAKVSWPALWDRDDATLTYQVYRDSANTKPIYTTTQTNFQWNGQPMSFTDTGLTPGATVKYAIRTLDPSGNLLNSSWVTTTVASGDLLGTYGNAVLGDGATKYWRLDESGSGVSDWAGADDTTAGSGVTRSTTGALANSSDTASTFDGTANDVVVSKQLVPGPNTFSEEAWFKTTSTTGGKIAGFGNSASGDSSAYDRHLFMDGDGRVYFGVWTGNAMTVNSAAGLNDGNWHQVVATLGSGGESLYIDGVRVASRTDVASAQAYDGYWRLGGDNTWAGDKYFNGSIDEFAVYPTVLTKQQVNNHWVASGRPSTVPPEPSDKLGKAMYDSSPDFYWRLDETGNASTAADSASGVNTGTYSGNVTLGQPGVPGGGGSSVQLGAPHDSTDGGNVTATRTVTNPTSFSQEVWVKTSTTTGGRILGLGNSGNGSFSDNYDRQIYMLDNGQVRWGVYNGNIVTIDSKNALNDGQWHQIVTTFDSGGMKLYVDGSLDASDPNNTAQDYTGYWKLGGDSTWGGNSSSYFSGNVDEAAVYPRALSASEVQSHFAAGTGSTPTNQPPTAKFTSTATKLSASFDASTSTGNDDSIAGYSWNFGDGNTDTGATPTHVYAAGGTYTVTLTVTDQGDATDTVSHAVTVVAPTAKFTSNVTNLSASFDASTSDGGGDTISGYSWNFGDGATDTGVSPSHTYATAGSKTVTLTLTDQGGAQDTVSHVITVNAASVPPTARFTSNVTNLSASFDASTSDGGSDTISGYSWNFGDGSTGTGATPSHNYTAAGTKTVTLTVTDQGGAQATVSHVITVTAPSTGVLASDTFNRTATNGWGTADTGGPWTIRGTASKASVTPGVAKFTMSSAMTQYADLNNVSATSAKVTTEFSVDKLYPGTAEGMYVAAVGRQIGTDFYAGRLVIAANGSVKLYLLRDSSALLAAYTVPGLTVVPGSHYKLSVLVSGISPTMVSAKVWKVGDAEPAAWQKSASNTFAALQAPGRVGLSAYLPAATTNAPITLSFYNLVASTS